MRWQKTALLVLLKGRLVGRAKPNVPFVRRQFKIFCAVGKKIKHSRVGNECRLTRCPFVISFLCLWSPVKIVYFSIYFSRFVVVVSFFTLAGNVLPLAAVGDFGALHCQPSTSFDSSTALDLTTSAPIAANGC